MEFSTASGKRRQKDRHIGEPAINLLLKTYIHNLDGLLAGVGELYDDPLSVCHLVEGESLGLGCNLVTEHKQDG